MEFPATVALSAWTGEGPVETVLEETRAERWGLRGKFPDGAQTAAPPRAVGEDKWAHEQNGWGLILPTPKTDDWSDADLALARDATLSIQRLVEERLGDGRIAPVFRWDDELGESYLRRHFADDRATTTVRYGQQFGLEGTNAVPLYLLIIADPSDIPWTLQYALNQRHHVGRLPGQTNETTTRYIDALLDDWADAGTDSREATVWCVDNDNMMRTMRGTIAHPIYQKLDQDSDITVDYLAANDASIANLCTSLQRKPGLIVTTSHGQTRPLNDPVALSAGVGLLVDQANTVLQTSDLSTGFPSGAFWYAHACCSAGTHGPSRYSQLLPDGSSAQKIVDGVGSLPSQIAPLPIALLGGENPIRGFIGHVEPTFDWPLIDQTTGQILTASLTTALYEQLYQPYPVGLAFDNYYRGIGNLYAEHMKHLDAVNRGRTDQIKPATYARLCASDRESLVLLGDPAVSLPALS